MTTEILTEDIKKQLIRQLSSLFLISESEEVLINREFENVLSRCEYCFSKNVNKYYFRSGQTYFNPYHSAQYTIFLYYFSHTIFQKTGNRVLADKLYYLNKMMNGCDLFYEVELPDYFLLDHPVGSVMGRAHYGDGFSFGQNCTVGNNRGIYPFIGNHVSMSANSSIIGNCHVGDRVILGAGCLIKDEDILADVIVFGQSPNLIIKRKF
ncbi:MAG: transferase [Odoribacter sp.]